MLKTSDEANAINWQETALEQAAEEDRAEGPLAGMTASVLTRDALVLNRSWLAIATTPVRHALTLVFTGAAQAIQPETFEVHSFDTWSSLGVPEDEDSVSTVSMELRVPEVIVLQRFSGVPRQALPFTRRNLVRRDHAQCQYCGCRPGSSDLSIDHVIPRSAGGATSWENCVLACVRCNRRKGNKLAHEVDMRLMRQARVPQWSPIFEVASSRKRDAWKRFVAERHWGAAS